MIDLRSLEAAQQLQKQQDIQNSPLANKAMERAAIQQSSYQIPEEFQSIIDNINAEREQQLIQDRMNVFNNYVQQRACGGCISHGSGGSIHIDPSKKGTFTAAASRHGMGVQAFASKVLANKENYSPAMVKKANFARNASKWHAEGGPLNSYGEGDVITISQLPREFVDANGAMMVRTPSGNAVPLSEAYSKWGGTHVNVNDVPGLTDYLLTQEQIQRYNDIKDLQMFRSRDAANREAARDRALYNGLIYTGGAGLAGYIAKGGLVPEGALDTATSAVSDLASKAGTVWAQLKNNPVVFANLLRIIRDSPVPEKTAKLLDKASGKVSGLVNTAQGWLPEEWFQAPGVPFGGGAFGGAGGGGSWGNYPYLELKPGTTLESIPLVGPIFGNPAEVMKQYSRGGYIEDGLRARGVTGFRVTSGYRGPNSKVGHAGKRSGHARYLSDGKSSGAIDIVPTDKSPEGWARLEQQLRRPEVEEFIRGEIGGTILAETDPATMRKTGATGPHYHIGLGVAGGGNFYGHNHSTVPRSASSRASGSSMPIIPFSLPEPMMAMAPIQEEPVRPEAPWWGSYLSTPQQAVSPTAASPFGEDYSFLDLAWNPMTGAYEPTTTPSSFPNLFAEGGDINKFDGNGNSQLLRDEDLLGTGWYWGSTNDVDFKDPLAKTIKDKSDRYLFDENHRLVPKSVALNYADNRTRLPEVVHVPDAQDLLAVENAKKLFGNNRAYAYSSMPDSFEPSRSINKLDTLFQKSAYPTVITNPFMTGLSRVIYGENMVMNDDGRMRPFVQDPWEWTYIEPTEDKFMHDYLSELAHTYVDSNREPAFANGVLYGIDAHTLPGDEYDARGYSDPKYHEFRAHHLVQPNINWYLMRPDATYNDFVNRLSTQAENLSQKFSSQR